MIGNRSIDSFNSFLQGLHPVLESNNPQNIQNLPFNEEYLTLLTSDVLIKLYKLIRQADEHQLRVIGEEKPRRISGELIERLLSIRLLDDGEFSQLDSFARDYFANDPLIDFLDYRADVLQQNLSWIQQEVLLHSELQKFAHRNSRFKNVVNRFDSGWLPGFTEPYVTPIFLILKKEKMQRDFQGYVRNGIVRRLTTSIEKVESPFSDQAKVDSDFKIAAEMAQRWAYSRLPPSEQHFVPYSFQDSFVYSGLLMMDKSAGLAFAYSAFARRYCFHTEFSPYIGFCGSLSGERKLEKVGHIKEKIRAAQEYGIRVVFLPQSNKKELEDLLGESPKEPQLIEYEEGPLGKVFFDKIWPKLLEFDRNWTEARKSIIVPEPSEAQLFIPTIRVAPTEPSLEIARLKDKIPLIGRKKELKQLMEWLYRTSLGRGSIVFIEGKAGIGKTCLVDELIREAKTQDFTILSASCLSETGYYRPFIKTLKEYFDSLSLEFDSTAQIDSQQVRGILTRINFKCATLSYSEEVTKFLNSETDKLPQGKVDNIVAILLKSISAKQPLLLVIDDLHLADELTLNLLTHLVSELESSPILICAAYRQEAKNSLAKILQGEVLQKLRNRELRQTIPISELDEKESVEMVDAWLYTPLSDDVKQFIVRRAEGNPFYIRELLKTVVGEEYLILENGVWRQRERVDLEAIIPKSIQEMVALRIDSLSKHERSVLNHAAVIGQEIPFDLLAGCVKQFAGVNYQDTEEAVKTLKEKVFLKDIDGKQLQKSYLFDHHMLQEIVYNLIESKSTVHKNVATVMEAIYKDRIEKFAPSLARHFNSGGDMMKALEYFMQAGKTAEDNYAWDDAIRYYEKALGLAEGQGDKEKQAEASLRLANRHRMIWDNKAANDYYRKAMKLYDVKRHPKEVAEIYHHIGVLLWRDRDREAFKHFNKSVEIAEIAGDAERIADVKNSIALCHYHQGEWEQAIKAYEKNKEERGEIFKPCVNIGNMYAHRGDAKKAMAYLREGLNKALDSENQWWIAVFYHFIGFLYLIQSCYDVAIQYLEKALEIFRGIPDPSYIGRTLINIGSAYGNRGELQQGIQRLEEGMTSLKEREYLGALAQGERMLSSFCRLKGQRKRAFKHARKCLVIQTNSKNIYDFPESYRELGLVYLEWGNLSKALEYLPIFRPIKPVFYTVLKRLQTQF